MAKKNSFKSLSSFTDAEIVCFKSFKILLEKGVKNGQHLSTIFDNF
jgi:hypothetical protein